MRNKFILVALFSCTLISFFISAVSAEIMISQPAATYNIGEELSLSVTVSEGGKQLEAEIICDNETKLIFFKNLGSDENSANIFQPLTKSFLGDMKGICNIQVEYGKETETSQDFKISGRIEIVLNIANLNYNAGDNIFITGEAAKENSLPVEGFIEITLENTNIKLRDSVVQGKFSANFTLPGNIKSGRYILNARVYEKDVQGGTGNEGEETAVIGVKQEVKKLEIAINQQTILPGENVNFKVLLYDQANYEMSGDASVIVKDTYDNEILKKLVKTNEEISLPVENNASAGYWKIEASSLGITSKRLFSVEENEKAKFELINDTLIITNIGNVIYRKAVQIVIETEVEIKELELGVGETKKFRLLAPDGNYKISVTDGSTTFSQSDVALTGNIIGVLDIRQQLTIWRKYPIVWLFIIMVAGLSILMLIQRTVKKRSYAYPVEEKKEKTRKGVKGLLKTIGKKQKTASETSKRTEAEHTLVLGGQKQNVALICLKIKKDISKEARAKLESAFREAYEIKAIPYETHNYIFLIFSPLITKTFKNYVPAVKASLGIVKALQEHNKKFREKIEFGIAVHCGEFANKIDDNKLKFTAMGNTLGKAKKIAELSGQEPLLSKELHEKTLPEIKAEKKEIKGQEVYQVRRIADSKRNKIFVQDFLKKLNEEKEKKKE